MLDASIGLNPFCVIYKVIQKGDFMTVSDLDSGYWHVPVHASHQQYLGLHFELGNGQVDYWVWVCMPLGIVDAAYIFTKITPPS